MEKWIKTLDIEDIKKTIKGIILEIDLDSLMEFKEHYRDGVSRA